MKEVRVFTDDAVSGFGIEGLKNNVHIEYVKDIEKAATDCQAIREHLAALVAEFTAAINREVSAGLKNEVSPTVKALQEAINDRDKGQTAFKAYCRAMMGMPDAQIAADGQALMELAHRYDAHAGMNPDEQTGLLIRFLTDLETNYLSQVERIGATVLFNQLKLLNERVCDLMAERDNENKDKVTGTVTMARRETDRAYRRLIRGVNSIAFIQGAAPYVDFITYVNEVILRYKRTHLKQHVSGPVASPGDELDGDEVEGLPGEGDNGPEYPETPGGDSGSTGSGSTGSEEKFTVAWYLPNGNPIIWYELAPGETIPEAPQAPDGYYWHPYPSTMPNHDLDIIPEPIKD